MSVRSVSSSPVVSAKGDAREEESKERAPSPLDPIHTLYQQNAARWAYQAEKGLSPENIPSLTRGLKPISTQKKKVLPSSGSPDSPHLLNWVKEGGATKVAEFHSPSSAITASPSGSSSEDFSEESTPLPALEKIDPLPELVLGTPWLSSLPPKKPVVEPPRSSTPVSSSRSSTPTSDFPPNERRVFGVELYTRISPEKVGTIDSKIGQIVKGFIVRRWVILPRGSDSSGASCWITESLEGTGLEEEISPKKPSKIYRP